MAITPEVDFEFTPNGDLLVKFNLRARRLVLFDKLQMEKSDQIYAEALQKYSQGETKLKPLGIRRNDRDIFLDYIEYQLCNGWSLIDPVKAGFLVSDDSVILCQDEVEDDQGEYLWIGKVYMWDFEAVYSYLDQIIRHGEIKFSLHQIDTPASIPQSEK